MPSEPGRPERPSADAPGSGDGGLDAPAWPTAAESSQALTIPPDVDGPPRRTSARTPAVVVATGVPFLLVAIIAIGFAIPVALAVVGYGVLTWWRRSYTVGSHELVVDEGVFTRRRRVVPYDRIQQVDTRQGIAARLFGVGELRVATAGGGEDAKLPYLEMPRAEGLRSYLLRRREELQGRSAADGADELDPSGGRDAGETPLLSLTPARLALASITDGSILAGAAGGFAVGLWAGAAVALGARFQLVLLLGSGVLAGMAVALASAIVVVVRNLVERYGFAVSVLGDDIQLRYGLLDVRHLTVPRRRVQQVRVVDNPLRRSLGLASLELHSATAGGDVTGFDIPLLRRGELDTLLAELMGTDDWRLPERIPRGDRARRRGIRRRVLLIALVVAPPAVALFPVGLPILALAAVGVPWGVVAHRRAGHGLSSTLVCLRHGALRHRIDLVPVARVQSARTTASPFQRRAGLASLHVDVAGASGPRLYDLDRQVAAALTLDLPRRSAGAGPTATRRARPAGA